MVRVPVQRRFQLLFQPDTIYKGRNRGKSYRQTAYTGVAGF